MSRHRALRRAALLLAVLLVHVGGALLLARSQPPSRPGRAAAPKPLMLRLLPLERRMAADAGTAPRATQPPAARTTANAPPRTPAAVAPQAITAPADTAPLAAARPASAPASEPPLDLRLHAAANRQAGSPATPAAEAVLDPRGNQHTQPRRWEDRLAQRLDTRVQETLAVDGRQTLRRGDGCLELRPARIAQLDPWSSRDAPRTAAPCD